MAVLFPYSNARLYIGTMPPFASSLLNDCRNLSSTVASSKPPPVDVLFVAASVDRNCLPKRDALWKIPLFRTSPVRKNAIIGMCLMRRYVRESCFPMISLGSSRLGQARVERCDSYDDLKQMTENNNLVNNNTLNISFKVNTGAVSVSNISEYVWDGCVSETLEFLEQIHKQKRTYFISSRLVFIVGGPKFFYYCSVGHIVDRLISELVSK